MVNDKLEFREVPDAKCDFLRHQCGEMAWRKEDHAQYSETPPCRFTGFQKTNYTVPVFHLMAWGSDKEKMWKMYNARRTK